MELLESLIDFILHIDRHLIVLVNEYHTWTYLILFLIIFAETGLVITPFLPGDSLLFATGALLTHPESELNIFLITGGLILAAVLGDGVNYHVGHYLGPKAFQGKYRLLKREYLERTQSFYQQYGGKTIVYSQFIPVIRTFAPFVAGIGTMPYQKFLTYNLVGAIAWVTGFLGLGYFFGSLPMVKEHFTYVVLFVILFSILLPLVMNFLKKRVTPSRRTPAENQIR